MIRVYIFTSTRAEYGLLKPVIRRLSEEKDYCIKLLVSGTHLLPEYGYTIGEIKEDGYADICEIDIQSKKRGAIAVSETMANAIIRFSEFFLKDKPDYLFIDGDRYESLAVAIAAVNNHIPIIHNGGGCTTEGAMDEYYRHAITKMSMLHFTSTPIYRNRIIQMGEDPSRVFAVGSLGIENALHVDLLSKQELSKQLEYRMVKPYAVLTFHPVTLEDDSYRKQVRELIDVLELTPDIDYIVTGANADNGGDEINRLFSEYCSNSKNSVFIKSMGMIRYLSALKYCEFVIGNSSSGLIEAPSFRIPTINIGDRQKGRIKAESIIDCVPESNAILDAIKMARSAKFKNICAKVINPNGDGKTSIRIVKAIKEYDKANRHVIQKSFFNVDLASSTLSTPKDKYDLIGIMH